MEGPLGLSEKFAHGRFLRKSDYPRDLLGKFFPDNPAAFQLFVSKLSSPKQEKRVGQILINIYSGQRRLLPLCRAAFPYLSSKAGHARVDILKSQWECSSRDVPKVVRANSHWWNIIVFFQCHCGNVWPTIFPVIPRCYDSIGVFAEAMKEINSFELIEVPEGIDVSVKARTITCKVSTNYRASFFSGPP